MHSSVVLQMSLFSVDVKTLELEKTMVDMIDEWLFIVKIDEKRDTGVLNTS